MNSLAQVDELVKEYLLVEKIIEELLGYITNGDIQGLVDYYRYLDLRFFSRLDSRFQPLPYIKNPASDPTFETYFTKYWVDNYTISLHNFLATTFQNMHRLQRKSQQTEIESLKNTVETQRATLEARENDIAKLRHQMLETRKEMTDGISFIRRRAASTTTEQKVIVNHPKRSNSESTAMRVAEEEPFLIVGQEEFYEHASAITHAKFSSQGDKVASCDMDNMVKIWNCKGQPVESFKIKNSPANVLSLEWDARSDKINQISSSPVEPIFICTGSSSKVLNNSKRSGTLVAWSMKSMSACMLVVGNNAGLMQIFGK
ncbi:hypothetical protein RO3G_13517 [Rhizopus delemar RA 99-880]|uniref:ARMC9 CTLH-like domain-containing protein n=1 Tax=Rhizopus delemar (strain RA 99-880 / ATCC MYA-4621 / FGSC 9543 / NRRL 43880) TaxID=246409 RepID=I1CK26_RHIO9|nr:hypothetical protein RO3G_13517 [Rhizopus delemar RA 99-880]|eukprot:EIE88806.1 hypothetical protein RO3G_13517 [Rhizopus delemar RA 99-880]